MQLLFDYPWYFVLLCLLVGAAYSFALYWQGRRKGRQTPKKTVWVTALLRFVTVSCIAFLLMAPMVKRQVHTHEKPLVVLLQDVSESVQPASRSSLNPQSAILNSQYEVVLDSFGGKSTDMAAALQSIADRYSGRNLGAVVVASDGICNQGQNPLTVAPSLAVPIYTVALGDTTRHPEASIGHVRYNQVAYLGNQFPMEVTIHSHLLQGQKGTLSVSHNGKTLWSKTITYTDNDFSTTETLTLEADRPGLQSYTLTLSPSPTRAAATRSIAVEVVDGQQKIAILAASAHPDVGALRRAIEKNPNYEVEVLEEADFNNKKLKDYSLIILHNLPSERWGPRVEQVPAIYIIGSQTDIGRFNAMHAGLEIVAKTRRYDEVTAMHNETFTLFNFDRELCRRLEDAPPLTAPFGTYRTAANLQSLFTAKVGNLDSGRPLIAFGQQEGVRHAFVVGEGLWRWRLQEYLVEGAQDGFDQLIEKMVVYTSLQTPKEQFRVTTRHIYHDNEDVLIEAELYNENYEPVNNADAEITVTSKDNTASQKPQQYAFNRSGSGYTLPLGTLSAGHYNYTATTTFAGKKLTASGSFIVEETHLEQANLVADHALLNTLAQTTGAQMLQPSEADQLPQLLADRDDLKSIVYAHTRYTELLNLPLIFILIVLLLAAEWAIRKWGYGDNRIV